MSVGAADLDARSSSSASAPAHPNALDRKRIERAIARRTRYRYVSPRVCSVQSGYAILSPCCSRRVEPRGGEIEIALVEFLAESSRWRLNGRDDASRSWVPYGEYATLAASLAPLLDDPDRRFWR